VKPLGRLHPVAPGSSKLKSEKEIKSILLWALQLKTKLIFGFTLHCYFQMHLTLHIH